MSLKYEPSSEPLHISAKQLVLDRDTSYAYDAEVFARLAGAVGDVLRSAIHERHGKPQAIHPTP